MKYTMDGSKNDEFYVAPVMGNGNMAFQADYEGTMYAKPNFDTIRNNTDLRIWWSARRYMHKPDFNLVSFGCFGHQIEGAKGSASYAEQFLDTENALMHTACKYGNIKVDTELFIHHDFNLIAVKKSVENTQEFCFEYNLCDVKDIDKLPELMTVTKVSEQKDGVDIEYKIDAGMYPYEGVVRVFGIGVAACTNGNKVILKAKNSGEFFVLFSDNVEREDYMEFSENIKKKALEIGFSAIKDEHVQKWKSYYDEGFAVIDDENINNAYNTAQYHLKCYTSDRSIPVGLNNGSWQGRYFAFDEFYMLMGLLTSNHMSAAAKIPKFRYDILEDALFRSSTRKNEVRGALYPWETLENGGEGAPRGFWLDHVFHMACISCGGYYYYKFTNDTDFLKECVYPVIKASSVFYMYNMIYKTDGGRVIVGKCTDLERLGSYRENAYMTTCGVIKTLLIFDEIAKILGCDDAFAAECRKTAEALKKDLPTDGKKYIPYSQCRETSIGLLGGTYPFDVIERNSELQNGGIKSYLESESRVGNMYSVGTGVCSWYMTWKAVVFARMNMKEETFEAIKNASRNTGYFGEMYEISDLSTKTVYRPWFTTAAGMLVHSVNEMLLQSDENIIYVAPSLPESIGSYSFRLSAYCGICVAVKVENRKLVKLRLTSDKKSVKNEFKIKIPDNLSVGSNIEFSDFKDGIMTVCAS